jgi:hypothetical protein
MLGGVLAGIVKASADFAAAQHSSAGVTRTSFCFVRPRAIGMRAAAPDGK